MNNCFPGSQPGLAAVVGNSGAGKSWLAGQLQERFGKEAGLLRQDDFYRDRAHLPVSRRSRVNFDHPRSIDWPLLEQVLLGVRKGLPIQTPRYDFTRHVRSGFEWWRPGPVVLMEGLWLLWRPSIRKLFTFSVFIECADKLCLSRRLKRDTVERGRSERSIRAQYRQHVAPMAERYVKPQARWASMVVQSPLSNETVDSIAARLREVLDSKGKETNTE